MNARVPARHRLEMESTRVVNMCATRQGRPPHRGLLRTKRLVYRRTYIFTRCLIVGPQGGNDSIFWVFWALSFEGVRGQSFIQQHLEVANIHQNRSIPAQAPF